MIRPSLVFRFFLLLVFGPGVTLAGAAPSSPLRSLSLEQKVGQLFLIGFPQKSFDSKVKSLLSEIKPGGLILFRRNLGDVDSIRAFTSVLSEETKKTAGVAPFMAVDQEGGPVARVPVFPPLPSAYAIGQAGREDLSQGLGEETGKILRWCGFNMNFAPVLDLSDPLKPSFIGPRSFGDSPERTGKLGTSFAQGLRLHGVLPTAKHFPGLGATNNDPHRRASAQAASKNDLQLHDLKPFEAYSSLGEHSALMVSQLSYPALDPEALPAPFSAKILKDLLRGELRYKGLIVTDDLQMKGTATILSPDEAAFRSLKAGADVVMLSWSEEDQKKAFNRVVRAVKTGEWALTELDERVQRILDVKSFLENFTEAPDLKIGRGPEGEPATKKLETIDLALLDLNLSSPISLAAPKSSDCVVASQERFLDSYAQGSRKKPRVFHIQPKTSANELNLSLSSCERIIFAVNGKKTVRLLSGLSLALRRKTMTVNLGLPSLIDAGLALAGRVDVGYPHLHAGYRVAQKLQGTLSPLAEKKESARKPASAH